MKEKKNWVYSPEPVLKIELQSEDRSCRTFAYERKKAKGQKIMFTIERGKEKA